MNDLGSRLARAQRLSGNTSLLYSRRVKHAAEKYQASVNKAYAEFQGDAQPPTTPLDQWRDWSAYATDAAQRSVLFWDTLRQRGNRWLEHERAGKPPVLHFEYETVLDARSFERPANYAMVRIVPPARVKVDPLKRPIADRGILGIAVAAAIAILRHRLYDIDLIINRTLVYTALTVGVAALYGLVVDALGVLFQASNNLFVSLMATGLAAILVQPMRDGLQRLVNRLMYGERDDPYAVLSKLSRRLEGFLSPEATLPAVVETVAQALKLPYVAIALKQEGDFKIAASYGLAKDEKVKLPLIYQGDSPSIPSSK